MKSAPASPRNAPSGSPEAGSFLEFVAPAPQPGQTGTFHPAEAILLLPGLNLNPARLYAWRDLWLGWGYGTVVVRLRGHRGAHDPDWRRIRPQDWADDLHLAVNAVRSRWPDARISCFGYSLGGLLALAWPLASGFRWHRVVCVCPAVRFRMPLAALTRWALTPLPGWLPFPSGAPRAYRLHGSSPVAVFRALEAWASRLPPPGSGSGLDASGGPQYWLYVPGDELVSTRAVRQYAETLGRTVRCEALELARIRKYPRHLAIDPESVGPDGWAKMAGNVQNWLHETATGGPLTDGPAVDRFREQPLGESRR